MTTTKLLSLTLLLAATTGACVVSSAEEVKDSSTSTELVSVEDSDLRNEEALRVAVGDFDDEEFLLSADEVATIANSAYVSLNDISAQGYERSVTSMFSGEALERVETTQGASSSFNGALTLAYANSETVTTRVSSVAMSPIFDDSTEQYATDAGKSYYEQVSTSNSGSAVTTYSATSFLGNSNSVGDGDGGYGTSAIDSGIVPFAATSRTWQGGADDNNNWSNGSNWSSTGWNSGDSAIFDATGSVYNSTVTVDMEIIVNDLTVSGDYTFEYSTGASLTVTGTVTISGGSGNDLLTINGGKTTFSGQYTRIGELGCTGTITILGSDTVVTFENELFLGYGFDADFHYSEGEIIIGSVNDTDGPYVTFGTGTSSATTGIQVGGPECTGKITINSGTTIFDTAVYLAYGYGSTGTLSINGGENTFNNDVYVSYAEGSTGTITISGGKNTFSEGSLWIGCYDTGEMTITGGENTFSGGSLCIGYAGDGYVTITDGTNTFNGEVDVGYGSTGSLTIEGGKNTFSGGSLWIGCYDTGEMTITGGETTFSGTYTCVGYGDEGTITITGGTNTFNGEVDVGYYDTGTITISGGTNTFSGGSLWIGCYDTGEMTITGGTNTFSGDLLYIGYSSTGEMTITGGNTTLKGATTIGESGLLSVSGGTLTIEKKIGTDATGSVTFSASGKLIVTQTLLKTAGELKEGEKAAVAVITANTITFGSDVLSGDGYVTDLVSSYITVQSGEYNVTGWYYYANNGTLYAIVAMPEPSMFGMMFGFASVGLVATRRRRRKAA